MKRDSCFCMGGLDSYPDSKATPEPQLINNIYSFSKASTYKNYKSSPELEKFPNSIAPKFSLNLAKAGNVQ